MVRTINTQKVFRMCIGGANNDVEGNIITEWGEAILEIVMYTGVSLDIGHITGKFFLWSNLWTKVNIIKYGLCIINETKSMRECAV